MIMYPWHGRYILPRIARILVLQSHIPLALVDFESLGAGERLRDLGRAGLELVLDHAKSRNELKLHPTCVVHLAPQERILTQVARREIELDLLSQRTISRRRLLPKNSAGVGVSGCG